MEIMKRSKRMKRMYVGCNKATTKQNKDKSVFKANNSEPETDSTNAKEVTMVKRKRKEKGCCQQESERRRNKI